jgi:hypothetical protein
MTQHHTKFHMLRSSGLLIIVIRKITKGHVRKIDFLQKYYPKKIHILQRMSLFILSGHKRVSSVATVSCFCWLQKVKK